jgi:hypothetical protein
MWEFTKKEQRENALGDVRKMSTFQYRKANPKLCVNYA